MKMPNYVLLRTGCYLDLDILDYLIDHGADVNVVSPNNRETIMHRLPLYARYWIDKGFKRINAQDDHGDTPLHLCASNGYFDICKILLIAGADPLIRNHNNLTAIYLARIEKHEDIVLLLEQHVPAQNRNQSKCMLM
jgi:ankyrin repeat protein